MTIVNLLAELVGLSVVIFAAVAWLKQLGLKGVQLTLGAFVFGAVLGVAYRYAQAPMVDFAGWFLAATFGLMAGFLATGAYKGAQAITGQDNPPVAPPAPLTLLTPPVNTADQVGPVVIPPVTPPAAQ